MTVALEEARMAKATSARSLLLALSVLLASALSAGCEPEHTTTSPTDAGAPDAADAKPVDLELPLEVLGPPGVSVALVFDLDETTFATASKQGLDLALTLHNIIEPNSCALSVNDDQPIDLGAADLPFLRARGGVTSGALHLAGSSLSAGRNRLTLGYTRQVAGVSGFRVLAAALSAGKESLLLKLGTAQNPPVVKHDQETIERGAHYFKEVSRDGGPVCAQCHTPNGVDLQYFSFSSFSIVERAMFHKFSRDEGEAIASYIRSLDVPSIGAVYSPPFQPGPGNHGAAGAGLAAVLPSDDAFSASLSGVPRLETVPAWDWANAIDTYRIEAPIQLPPWFRWLPRDVKPEWFTAHDGQLAAAEKALIEDPTLEHAQQFEAVAVSLGKEIMVLDHDHDQRIQLMRFAAVRLWDWSRKQGFDEPHHGFPDGAPAYPYEIGFAMFEAIKEQISIPEGAEQVFQWWWLQLTVDPGRGLSDGRRPLNFQDVQIATDLAGAGLAQRGFIHLLGSWEESRGNMAASFGTEKGPVRLLATMMNTLPALQRETVLRRFFEQEKSFISQGGTLDENHHGLLQAAWGAGCEGLSADVVAALRAAAPDDVLADLTACP
jgi:mono/diheme cytochrome c family protein